MQPKSSPSLSPLSYSSLALALGFSLALATAPYKAIAEDTAAPETTSKKEEKPEVVKTGVVASQITITRKGAVDVDTAGSTPGDDASVLTGSVGRTAEGRCVVKINNSGKKDYSVSYEIVGKDGSGSTKFSKSFSSTVKSQKGVDQSISCPKDVNLFTVIKSAKALK